MTLTIKPAAYVVTGSPQYVDRPRHEVGQVLQLAVVGRRLREPLHRVDSFKAASVMAKIKSVEGAPSGRYISKLPRKCQPSRLALSWAVNKKQKASNLLYTTPYSYEL